MRTVSAPHLPATRSDNAAEAELREAGATWSGVQERSGQADSAEAPAVVEDAGALRRAQQRLQLALDGGKMGTWDIDLSTGVMRCSGQCKANYGRAPEAEFTYDDLAASVHPDDVTRWRLAVDDAIASGGEFGIDYRAIWPDGSTHWVYVRGNCELDEHGRATALSGVSIDVTDRKRVQQLDQQRADAATQESRKKSEFLAILSHELRGPLGPVSGALQALKMRGDNRKDREWLIGLAERQLRHMMVLIDDLLDIARVERGEIRLRLAQTDLRTPLRLAIEACDALFTSRGQRFEASGFDEPVVVMADPTRITQVVANLLNNASKYTPPHGHIRLALSKRDQQAQIDVIDNGAGLAQEALDRVFQMFEQVANQKSNAQGGLGIGLALARQLVQLHGGAITAHSDGPDCGSQFSITLPLTPA